MNPSRREKVREILISKPFTSLEELEKLFPDVSSMTLRRDIEYYEKEGLVIKVRGGARCKRYIALSEEGTFFARASLYTEEKQRIARTAVNFIGSAETVFLDSGSTVAQMNHYLPKRDLTIYTADPTIALDLVEKENIELLSVWQQSPWLKGELVLLLDSSCEKELCGYRLKYEKDQGLTYEKEGE